jgi:glycosyltransferase involved in cell wall biosynthesis
VCLLPARNAEEHVGPYLASVAPFADAVVALDDGSTDATGDLLEEAPLVDHVLRNGRRDGYGGWSDGENRTRLLRAAAELEPDWIVFLDADERVDPADAHALAAALEGDDLLPGCAYGFQHYRTWHGTACDPRYRWIYRMFGYRPDLRLVGRRLHFNPVPVEIPSRAWVRTTIRIRHLVADDASAIERRRAKYREADPEGIFGSDSGGMDRAPERVAPWVDRPSELPFLFDQTVEAFSA